VNRAPSNLPVSIRQRLRNKARKEGRAPGELMQLFAMERFLYRLGRSQHRDRFILKDFYDVWMLAGQYRFDQRELRAAVRATFQRRGTPMGGLPKILEPCFGQIDEKQKQWSAFIAKSCLKQAPTQFCEVTAMIATFVAPIFGAQEDNVMDFVVWDPPGPWRLISAKGQIS
jgi:hypothetical protein